MFDVFQPGCYCSWKYRTVSSYNSKYNCLLLSDFYASGQSRLTGGILFSTCPFVHPFICYRTCERDILKKKEPILMENGTIGQLDKGVKLHCVRKKMEPIIF